MNKIKKNRYFRIVYFLFFIFFIFFSNINVLAYEIENDLMTEEIIEIDLDFDTVEITLDDGTTFTETIKAIFSGQFDFSIESIKDEFLNLVTYEFKVQKKLMIQLLLIVILSAILKQISQSFSGKSVGDMGFFVCYMVLVVVIIDSFYDISQMVLNRSEQISMAFFSMVPIFITLCIVNGSVAQTTFLGTSIMTCSSGIVYIIKDLILPTILLTMSMEMADNISEKPMLSRLVKLIKSGICSTLKILATGFMMLTSLQKIAGEAVNNVAIKTAKIAVKAVPVVGDVMGGAVDTMTTITGSLKNGVLVGVVVFLIMLALPIIVKLVVIYFIFKIISAVGEFICEERLVECISSVADYIGIMIGVVFLMQGIFIFSAVLLLYTI